jgi:AcrR family transcriptional regulator
MSHVSDKRERLLEACKRLIHCQGFRHTTLADIAQESGVPLGNVYYYFRTKQDLLGAVVDRWSDDFRSRTAELEARTDDPRARLLTFLDAIIANRAAFAEHGCPVGSLSQEVNKDDGCAIRDRINRALIQRAEWVSEQFRLMGRRDAQDLGVALVASVQGIALMANAMRDPQVVARQVARVKEWVGQL